MQDNAMQSSFQPFVNLAQANMDLFTRFSTSEEVSSQAIASANQLFQQTTGATMKLMQSGAFAHLMQGMLQNYTEFLSELGRSGMTMVSQSQAALIRRTQETTDSVIDAAGSRARRSR